MSLGTVSVNAGPIFEASNGLLIMSGAVYIHEITPELARQWIGVLTTIAEGKDEPPAP